MPSALPQDDLLQILAELGWATQFEGSVWAMRPDVLLAIQSVKGIDRLNVLMAEAAVDAIDGSEDKQAARPRGRPPAINGDVMVLPLKGVLTPNVSFLAMLFGIESGLVSFRRQLRNAAVDSEIGAIVMDVDSPGGVVDLIPEVAEEIRQAAAKKPVIAVANTLAASAAYWLASQATEVVATPSAELGSIGVYAEHRDISVALEQAGIKPTLVSAGKFKVQGNPYQPLDKEALAAIQEGVDDYYTMFTKDVATGRGASVSDVRSGFGEGKMLTAKRAVDAGLADRIDTLDNVIAGLVRRSRGGNNGTNSLGAEESPVEYSAEDRGRLVAMSGVLNFT